MTKQQVRCAVYTRKSSEEGLEQSFNSLDAQREACVAYINSQKHEGWTLVKDEYDDGGFFGGTIHRPALTRLLADVSAGMVDTIIVYKVDRLTRSLADFAKIIEVLDSHGTSFVSVTQQFNTTTSMGRLTLNVLLSFAQFERELTGERIRDKVAASKRKGMWMGGVVPFGYECINHRLIINAKEAETLRELFRQYLRLRSVNALRNHLRKHELRSKVRTSKTGRVTGGVNYSRGALYHLLNNRTYIGEIVHRDQSYPGQHEAIIKRETRDKVIALLNSNNRSHRTRKSASTPSLLTGLLFDTQGVRFTPTHAVKKGKRYRYYTSQAEIQKSSTKPKLTRIPAQELETLVLSQIHLLIGTPNEVVRYLANDPEKERASERAMKLAESWLTGETSKQHAFVRDVLRRVIVGQRTVWIEVDRVKLLEYLLGPEAEGSILGDNDGLIKLSATFEPLYRGRALRLVEAEKAGSEGITVPSLVKAVARARVWYERIVSGEVSSVSQLADEVKLSSTYIKRVLGGAALSPQVVEAVLSGQHSSSLKFWVLLRRIPLDWQKQSPRL